MLGIFLFVFCGGAPIEHPNFAAPGLHGYWQPAVPPQPAAAAFARQTADAVSYLDYLKKTITATTKSTIGCYGEVTGQDHLGGALLTVTGYKVFVAGVAFANVLELHIKALIGNYVKLAKQVTADAAPQPVVVAAPPPPRNTPEKAAIPPAAERGSSPAIEHVASASAAAQPPTTPTEKHQPVVVAAASSTAPTTPSNTEEIATPPTTPPAKELQPVAAVQPAAAIPPPAATASAAPAPEGSLAAATPAAVANFQGLNYVGVLPNECTFVQRFNRLKKSDQTDFIKAWNDRTNQEQQKVVAARLVQLKPKQLNSLFGSPATFV
ncbi:MAG: hypothetical protein AAB323_00495 [Pseudomonadota bacterium]